MSEPSKKVPSEKTVLLKDPVLAAFLAWLVPGLGHLYQGRTGKAILFFICILGTFAYGCYLGGDAKIGWARVVYFQWDEEDMRLPFLCQMGMGLPTLPAVVQAYRAGHGREPLWGQFMAPPRRAGGALPAPRPARNAEGALAEQWTLDDLHFHLRPYFELGTVFTMIAGLLNVLAVYDAWGGPVFAEPAPAPKDAKDEDDQDLEAEAERPATGS